MSGGWIKIHRKLSEHWIYQDSNYLHWWIDILLAANFEDKKVLIKGALYDCKRGQSVYSLDTWAKRWNTDKSKVRRFLSMLETDGMITLENISVSTRLTVCKYECYQDERHADETQVKRKRNADETQMTPTKEFKNDKKEKKEEEIYIHFDHLSISTAEHQKLIDAGYTEQQVHEIYQDIQNYKGNKNYKSLYLTSLKWLGMNKTKEQAKTSNPKWLIAHCDNIMQICETEEQAKKALENIKSQLKHCPYEVRFEANFVSQYERLVF